MALTFKEIGARLQLHRSRLNLTQEQVANAIGVSRQVYGKIENGQKAINGLELQRLHEALAFSVDELLRPPVHNEGVAKMFWGKASSEAARRALDEIEDCMREIAWQHKIREGERLQ